MKCNILLLLLLPTLLFSQKKPLAIGDIQLWKKIESPKISPDGQWVAYLLAPTTEGDNSLCLWNAKTEQTSRFERADDPQFSYDGQYLVFKIKPALDTLKAQRRRKVKKEDLPKDSLAVLTLATGILQKFPDLRSYALPEKWSGWLAYQLEPLQPEKPKKEEENAEPDSTQTATAPPAEKKAKKPKKEDTKENGSRLVLYELATGRADTMPFVLEYRFAKRGASLLLHSTGRDSGFSAGVYRFDCRHGQLQPLLQAEKGKFAQLALDDWGRQAAFLADTDTTKARIRPWQLCYWSEEKPTTRILADTGSAFLKMPGGTWLISEYARPEFSDDGSKLFFGMAPPPILADTSLLPEEIVDVEVWAWDSNRLYTEMEDRLAADKKRSYPVLCRLPENKFVPLGSPEIPDWRFQRERDADWALAFSEEPYAQYRQWEGEAPRDLYAVDLKTGLRQQLVQQLRCSPQLSPEANYIFWWSDPDTAWYANRTGQKWVRRLTDNRSVNFFNEESDVPDYPGTYGMAGWLAGDSALLVYDRYDIWKIDPDGEVAPERLTQGRENLTNYRYLRLDPEERAIQPDAKILLHQFNHSSKAEGYAWLNLNTNFLQPWIGSDHDYTRSPIKAEKADQLIFARQNYQNFPDLLLIQLPPLQTSNLQLPTSNFKPPTSN